MHHGTLWASVSPSAHCTRAPEDQTSKAQGKQTKPNGLVAPAEAYAVEGFIAPVLAK